MGAVTTGALLTVTTFAASAASPTPLSAVQDTCFTWTPHVTTLYTRETLYLHVTRDSDTVTVPHLPGDVVDHRGHQEAGLAM